MWPQKIDDWLTFYQGGYDDYMGEDERETHNRLKQYPPLASHAARIAKEAASRTRVLAKTFHRLHDDLFDSAQFGRWIRVTTWTQALRQVLLPEQIERVLYQLSPKHRRLLQWRYLDLLHDEDAAKISGLPGEAIGLWGEKAACLLSKEAFHAFERLLRQAFGGTGPDRRDRSRFFPMYPGGKS